MKTFLFLLLFCMSLKIQAQFATTPLGSSSNAFSGIGDRPLQYSPYSGVIAFIHRQNTNSFQD